MRLAWLFLALLAAACVAEVVVEEDFFASSGSTEAEITTTAAAGSEPAQTTSGSTDEPEPSKGSEPTEEPSEPKTEPPEPTEDPDYTGSTTLKTTTKKAEGTTTVKTTKKAVSTTTKEPRPNVEDWSVTCDAVSHLCTYTMQVPGLDIDTYNDLIKETDDTETEVLNFQDVDLVNLQQGVTKVFDDADATADYVEDQLGQITAEITALNDQVTDLKNAFNALNTSCNNADYNLQKILAKKGSCLYRQCVLKETTTPRPTTTTTFRTTPTPFCLRDENKDPKICKNEGTCVTWYDSYYCTCPGNLDGQDLNCVTSVCDVNKSPQVPGPIYSPGYNGTDYKGPADDAEDCDDGAQWTVKAIDSKNVLTLAESETDWGKNGDDFIYQLSSDSNLQITVGKYKLKVTKKTKYQQIVQVLNYGATATISYSGPKEDYFHFTLKEIPPPPTPAP